MIKVHDLAIIGTGPAGYAAAIYASRYKLDFILIGQVSGGLVSEAHTICNYPGFQSITGMELTQKFKEHISMLSVQEVNDEVTEVKESNGEFSITTRSDQKYYAKSVLLAIGTKRRKLNLSNEAKFLGKGVSYCATCDGGFFKDKIVAVVGGSDAANTASLYLAKLASKVYQIYRKDKLRGDPTWADQVMKNEKIEVVLNSNIAELIGEDNLEKIILDRGQEIKVDGLFVEIGSVPNETLIKQLNIKTDDEKYIIVNAAQRTNIDGVWAAGDITTASNGFRQVITACAEGSIAANDIFTHISRNT
ncbi:FAD-dependent oxidoreductase [Candidatus Dojkabacteria bacterium]|nr:FAD-dependent oxidoreductase [Candidatus Dojkabacteria bacterium]